MMVILESLSDNSNTSIFSCFSLLIAVAVFLQFEMFLVLGVTSGF